MFKFVPGLLFLVASILSPVPQSRAQEVVLLQPNYTIGSEFAVAATDSPASPIAAVNQITWDLATEYRSGAYNGTFTFGSIQYALDGLGRYLNVSFRRVTRGGQFHVIQSSRNGPGAAWTSGNVIKISPSFRFANEVHCGMVIVHEFLHFRNGGHHAQDGGIMGPNGGYLLLPSDYPWMAPRGWKSSLRPTREPTWFKDYLSRRATLFDPVR